MKFFLASVAVLLFAVTGCKPKEQPAALESAQADVPVEAGEPDYENLPALKFEFTAQRTGNSISFRSATGTEWKEASYTCKELPCEFYLNNYGINSKTPATVFVIPFTLTEKEVKMESISMAPRKGSSWETLTYACETKTCKFKVTQDGVSGI